MAMYPDVQKKAQAELDAVIGSHSLPDFSDRPNLPYVEAVVKECLRWHNVATLGVPHVSSEDIEVRGYLIPKGSVLIPNAWYVVLSPYATQAAWAYTPEGRCRARRANIPIRTISNPSGSFSMASRTPKCGIRTSGSSVLVGGTCPFTTSRKDTSRYSLDLGFVLDGIWLTLHSSSSLLRSCTHSTSRLL